MVDKDQEQQQDQDQLEQQPEPAQEKVLWKSPHPNSALMVAAEAMERAEDKILATAFRRLAVAEANRGLGGRDNLLDYTGIRTWLEEVRSNIDWLLAHIHDDEFTLDLQEETSKHRKAKQCEWCGKWFIPERSTGKYCRPSHNVAAAKAKRRRGSGKR